MKMGRFLSVQEVKEPSAQQDAHGTESGKNNGEGQADLSHQLERKTGIVPHIPVQELIDDDPGRELARGHKDHAPAYLFPQRSIPPGPHTLLGKKHKADSAQKEHGPVRKPPKYHLECIVKRSAKSSQK